VCPLPGVEGVLTVAPAPPCPMPILTVRLPLTTTRSPSDREPVAGLQATMHTPTCSPLHLTSPTAAMKYPCIDLCSPYFM